MSGAAAEALTARREEIRFQAGRLLRHVREVESAARRAEPDPRSFFGWPPFTLDTGLTADQETFVAQWSPAEVLDHCYAQREMLGLLRGWLSRHAEAEDLDLALALVVAFSDRPEPRRAPEAASRAPLAGVDPRSEAWPEDERAISVALLDRNGVIEAVNQVWIDFCTTNGGQLEACGPGSSYLDACAEGGDQTSAEVARAIEQAIRGESLRAVTLTLPCHSPTRQRWYDILISSRLSADARTICGATVVLAPTEAPIRRFDASTPAGRAGLAAQLHHDVADELYRSTARICSVLDRISDPVALDRIHRGVRDLDHVLDRLRGIAARLSGRAA